ncbi:MAG: hypothetical protein QOD68_2778 [Actinomycetota bacterium]|jgi:uncharacterized protein YndB with AHSA1/START domain|nr:hypothetical protein [Actinomycetota bacterium]
MTTTTDDIAPAMTTTQVHRVYIKADAQKIWDAITQPEWTVRYGYTGVVDYDLRPGGRFAVHPTDEFRAGAEASGHPGLPDTIIDGEVLECEPPHRLVTTWRMLMDAGTAGEGFTRLTYEIKQLGGFCSLTVVHELEGAPKLYEILSGSLEDHGAGGGHSWVLSDLKSLLETGSGLAG